MIAQLNAADLIIFRRLTNSAYYEDGDETTIWKQMGWIAEWDPGVEFFEGAGQYTGGRRMLFCSGTQEIEYFDPVTQQLMTTAFGELNLTSEGLQMFRNAIAYLLRPEREPESELEP